MSSLSQPACGAAVWPARGRAAWSASPAAAPGAPARAPTRALRVRGARVLRSRPTALASATPAPARPAAAAGLRVAIVGAGVGGLTLAIALRRALPSADIALFEGTSEERWSQTSGAMFNLNGGAAVLHDLGLGEALNRIGHPMRRVLGRTVGGRTILDVDVEALVGGSPALLRAGRSVAVTVRRSELRAALAAALPPGCRPHFGARVAGLLPGGGLALAPPPPPAAAAGAAPAPPPSAQAAASAAAGAAAAAAAAAAGPFDLVVAADGLRSALRSSAFPGSSPPRYTGVRIAFAVAPRAALARPFGEASQFFGPNGYCSLFTAGGAAPGAGGAHCLAFCWRDDRPPSVGENAAWAPAAAGAADALLARLDAGGFPAPARAVAAAAAQAGTVFEIGVHDHEPLPAAGWWCLRGAGGAADGATSGATVVALLGDAAHAMPPFLGQGANQAVQDAACLAAALRAECAGLSDEDGVGGAGAGAGAGAGGGRLAAAAARAASSYAAVRSGPTAALQTSSRLVGWLDTLAAPWHLLRDAALAVAGATGVAGAVFLAGALPRTGAHRAAGG